MSQWFLEQNNKGIRLDGNIPTVVELGDEWSKDDLLVHNKKDYMIASMHLIWPQNLIR